MTQGVALGWIILSFQAACWLTKFSNAGQFEMKNRSPESRQSSDLFQSDTPTAARNLTTFKAKKNSVHNTAVVLQQGATQDQDELNRKFP